MAAMTNCIGGWARFHSLALILWSLFLIAGLAIVDDYGVSWDTKGQRLVAIDTVNYVLHEDRTLLQTHDRFYGAALELPLLLLTERALGLEDPRHVYLTRHVLTHLFFLLGGFCCYLLAWRLAGDRLTALLVMALFLLSPRLYAHSFFNSKDPVLASAFVMTLLFVCRAFDKDSVGAYRWCGAAAGLLINLRIMGVVLFAAVLVFRAWAWFRAEGDAARRRAVATAGVFALWGGLVLFISLPYLWEDPIGHLSEYWIVSADHASYRGRHQLFRGHIFSGSALPWDYVLHWFAISQPPVTLLLGLLGLGTLGLAAKGVFRRGAGAGPGRGLGVAELRFGALLATCFVLPLVAFVLLRPNVNHDWRHFYFLHGPFCLLAAFALMGMRQLPVQGLRKEWLGGAACALTAAGLGAAALEMAQIHPNQHLYFNFLADRKTPERLLSRYITDQHFTELRQSYEYLLRQTPAAAINMEKKYSTSVLNLWKTILPAADRRRFIYDPSRDPEFYLDIKENAIQRGLLDIKENAIQRGLPEDPFPPILHRFKVYNDTIATVSTPDLSRVDPAVAEAYRALHRAATAGAPVARAGGYEVYRHGSRLAWVKEACEPGALMREFLLKLYPVQERHHIEFEAYGVRFDGKCLGAARLPDFALARARLWQSAPDGGVLWETELPL